MVGSHTIVKVKQGTLPHRFNQRDNLLCRACMRVRPRYEFPLVSDHCYDCTTHRPCVVCGEVKLVTEFGRKGRGWLSECKPCRLVVRNARARIRRFKIYERDGGVCHLCGESAARADFHVDHLVPRVLGGSDRAENLAVAHPTCNLKKGPNPWVGTLAS